MAKKDPAKSAAKWQRNLQAAADTDYVDGTMALTEAPGAQAARKQATFKAKINKAIDDGTWAKNVAAVTLAEHQDAVKTRGARNLAQAATDKKQNMENFAQGFNEAAYSISQKIRAMPNTTDADNNARMVANVTAMRALKGKYSKRR